MGITETMIDVPAEHARNVFGQFDVYIKKIERTLNVTVILRDHMMKLIGDSVQVSKAKSVFLNLLELSKKGEVITEQNVNYALSLSFDNNESSIVTLNKDIICHTINGKPIKPKTLGQKSYVEQIKDKMIVFGIGPAGTGKTYLAMAMAITAFKNNEVNRIILTRPAIEAGEKLGFLPGDLQSKIDPYLRPLYDALYEIMGADAYLKNMEKGLIEVAPLAYMRGRTLDNSFIVLDEAQIEEMEAALNCRIVDARPYGLTIGDLYTNVGWTRNAGGEQMVLPLLEQESYDSYSIAMQKVAEAEAALESAADAAAQEVLDILNGEVEA